jgi:hypothetical protein
LEMVGGAFFRNRLQKLSDGGDDKRWQRGPTEPLYPKRKTPTGLARWGLPFCWQIASQRLTTDFCGFRAPADIVHKVAVIFDIEVEALLIVNNRMNLTDVLETEQALDSVSVFTLDNADAEGCCSPIVSKSPVQQPEFGQCHECPTAFLPAARDRWFRPSSAKRSFSALDCLGFAAFTSVPDLGRVTFLDLNTFST